MCFEGIDKMYTYGGLEVDTLKLCFIVEEDSVISVEYRFDVIEE